MKIMGNQGKHAAKYSVYLEIQCQIMSLKFKFCNVCELNLLVILERRLDSSNLRNVAVFQLFFGFPYIC